MRVRALVLLALASAAAAAAPASKDERPSLDAVTAVRVANYGSPSVLIAERQQVRAIVDELLAARKKRWRRGDAKLACYSSVMLLMGEKSMVALFRVADERVVERPVTSGKSSYSLALGESDLPGLRRLLAEIPPPRCRVAASH